MGISALGSRCRRWYTIKCCILFWHICRKKIQLRDLDCSNICTSVFLFDGCYFPGQIIVIYTDLHFHSQVDICWRTHKIHCISSGRIISLGWYIGRSDRSLVDADRVDLFLLSTEERSTINFLCRITCNYRKFLSNIYIHIIRTDLCILA